MICDKIWSCFHPYHVDDIHSSMGSCDMFTSMNAYATKWFIIVALNIICVPPTSWNNAKSIYCKFCIQLTSVKLVVFTL